MAIKYESLSSPQQLAAALGIWDERNALSAEFRRYADFYDGRPQTVEKYFQRLKRETDLRWEERPKLSFPLCHGIIDLHAQALRGETLTLEIEDKATRETWAEIEAHNNMDAFATAIVSTAGLFGAAIVRPIKHNDGSSEKKIEFEVFNPDRARPIYDSGSGGRSVRRIRGVVIRTLYNRDTYEILEYNATRLTGGRICERVELITEYVWRVWLDGKETPIGPGGEMWMPRLDGKNPFGLPVFFNNLDTFDTFIGPSDIKRAVHDNHVINELWSHIVYACRLLVPILAVFTDNEDAQTSLVTGLGAAIGLNKDDDARYVSAPPETVKQMLEPMRIALELFFSNAHAPAAAVGLGHLFSGEANVSGRSKEIEYRPTVQYREQKWPMFERGYIEVARLGLRVATGATPDGQAKPGDPEADMTVKTTGEIIPQTRMERIEEEGKAILYGLSNLFRSAMRVHNMNAEQAAAFCDEMLGMQKRVLLGLGAKDVLAAAAAQSKLTVSSSDIEANRVKIFAPAPVADADAADQDTEEETAAKE